MARYPRSRRISMTALHVFECATRHRHFGRAADELNISHPSISRHIADLELELSVKLFERERRRVRPTDAGESLYRTVVAGLKRIETGIGRLVDDQSASRKLVVACGQITSQLFLLPRFETLRQTLGEDVDIEVLSCDYDMLESLCASDADIVISFDVADSTPEERCVALRQEAIAVCSPDFARAHMHTLCGPVTEWGAVPFLSYARPSRGWATWGDWFDIAGHPDPPPEFTEYDAYLYLLDAVIDGRGLGLCWRGLADRHIESGKLIQAADCVLEFPRPLYARLTGQGRLNPLAWQGLESFAS